MTHLRIRTAAGQSHRRAGRRWTDEPQTVALADLTPADVAALRADRRLFVEVVEVVEPKSPKPAKPPKDTMTPAEGEGEG